jgi:hypothetical protein
MNSWPTGLKTNLRGTYPALPYQKALIQFAKKEGMKIWTVQERIKVIARYEVFAATKN